MEEGMLMMIIGSGGMLVSFILFGLCQKISKKRKHEMLEMIGRE